MPDPTHREIHGVPRKRSCGDFSEAGHAAHVPECEGCQEADTEESK